MTRTEPPRADAAPGPHADAQYSRTGMLDAAPPREIEADAAGRHGG